MLNYKFMTIVALGASMASVAEAAKRPNVIVILADDMGFADAGFTGSKDIKTPNLDALAADGVVFTNGYANHPFSGPSRAALMSGRYQYRFGFEANPGHDPNSMQGVPLSETLFPERMQSVGYKTCAIGKWHLGGAPALHPCNRGFDFFYGFIGGSHDYFASSISDPNDNGPKAVVMRNKKVETFDGYLTNVLTDNAVQFVEDNKDDPFFVYLAYNAPHAPLQAPKVNVAKYAHIKDWKRRTYAAMVDAMDIGIGRVVETLKKNGLYENTLIFFMSDNGGPSDNGSCNEPFRGHKGSLLEGGVHVPFMACWPAKFKAGATYDYPVNSLDISRTAVAVAKGDIKKAPMMEGTDLVPYVTGKQKSAPHEFIYWRAGNGVSKSAVSSTGEKYMIWGKNAPKLYNLTNDITEEVDVASKSPQSVKAMGKAVEEWNKQNIDNKIVPMKHR